MYFGEVFTIVVGPFLTHIIELHAPTGSTQKLKLIGKGGQFTYTSTLPLTCKLPQAAYVDIGVGCTYFY
jgi:hypothetical protein